MLMHKPGFLPQPWFLWILLCLPLFLRQLKVWIEDVPQKAPPKHEKISNDIPAQESQLDVPHDHELMPEFRWYIACLIFSMHPTMDSLDSLSPALPPAGSSFFSATSQIGKCVSMQNELSCGHGWWLPRHLNCRLKRTGWTIGVLSWVLGDAPETFDVFAGPFRSMGWMPRDPKKIEG